MDLNLSVKDLALLSQAAYAAGGPIPYGYDLIAQKATKQGAFIQVWRAPNGQRVYAFRGTDTGGDLLSDILADVSIIKQEVSDAARSALTWVRDYEERNPSGDLAPVFTGHSKGGYEAQYISTLLQSHGTPAYAVTFDAPALTPSAELAIIPDFDYQNLNIYTQSDPVTAFTLRQGGVLLGHNIVVPAGPKPRETLMYCDSALTLGQYSPQLYNFDGSLLSGDLALKSHFAYRCLAKIGEAHALTTIIDWLQNETSWERDSAADFSKDYSSTTGSYASLYDVMNAVASPTVALIDDIIDKLSVEGRNIRFTLSNGNSFSLNEHGKICYGEEKQAGGLIETAIKYFINKCEENGSVSTNVTDVNSNVIAKNPFKYIDGTSARYFPMNKDGSVTMFLYGDRTQKTTDNRFNNKFTKIVNKANSNSIYTIFREYDKKNNQKVLSANGILRAGPHLSSPAARAKIIARKQQELADIEAQRRRGPAFDLNGPIIKNTPLQSEMAQIRAEQRNQKSNLLSATRAQIMANTQQRIADIKAKGGGFSLNLEDLERQDTGLTDSPMRIYELELGGTGSLMGQPPTDPLSNNMPPTYPGLWGGEASHSLGKDMSWTGMQAMSTFVQEIVSGQMQAMAAANAAVSEVDSVLSRGGTGADSMTGARLSGSLHDGAIGGP